MTTETLSLHQYHTQEWETFAREQYDLEISDGTWDDDEAPEFDENYIFRMADSYWQEFENECGSTVDVWADIHYSAGVYLGEIDDSNITNRVILQDEIFYNDEGDQIIKDVDMVEVTLMNVNPDLYGDECEAFIGQVINELADQGMIQILVDLNGKDSLGEYITSEMTSRRPELVEVLLEWNQNLTYDQVIDSMNDANNGGVVAFFEARGIDF